MICDYCGCNKATPYPPAKFHQVLQCPNCGLVFLDHQTSKEDTEIFYALGEYRRNHTWKPRRSPAAHYAQYKSWRTPDVQAQLIGHAVDIKGKSVLELGSASGILLDKLLELGAARVVGLELDTEYAEFSRGLGLEIILSPIERLDFKEEFDIVVAFHVMEHVYSPTTTLQAVNKALKPEGFFIGECPNVVSTIHLSEHYYYYSVATLRNYLKSYGFTDVIIMSTDDLIWWICIKDGTYVKSC